MAIHDRDTRGADPVRIGQTAPGDDLRPARDEGIRTHEQVDGLGVLIGDEDSTPHAHPAVGRDVVRCSQSHQSAWRGETDLRARVPGPQPLEEKPVGGGAIGISCQARIDLDHQAVARVRRSVRPCLPGPPEQKRAAHYDRE